MKSLFSPPNRCFQTVLRCAAPLIFQAIALAVPPGPVEFSAGGFSVSETGRTAVITVTRIQLDGDPFSVSYATGDGSARAGDDYLPAAGTLHFAPYQTNAVFTVTILNDELFEGIKTVTLSLMNPTDGATLGSRSNAVLSIFDDESITPGALDPSFDPGSGVQGIVRCVAADGYDRVIVGGDFDVINGTALNGLARLNADGSVDTTFQPALAAGSQVYCVGRQTDGKLIIGGSFTAIGGVSRPRIARLLSDGSLDATFDPGTGADREVLSLSVQADGRIVMAGAFDTVQGYWRSGLARLHADGRLDTSFAPPVPYGVVRCALTQSNGTVLVAGAFTAMNQFSRTFVARLNADGTLDTTFNPGNGNTVHNGTGVYSLAVQPDGKIILSGDFSILFGRGQSALMRLHPDGALDESFAPNVPTGDAIGTVALQADGRVIVGGNFSRLANPQCCALFSRQGLARLNSDGSVDTSFDPGSGASPQSVNTIVLQRDLKVVAGGGFTDCNGYSRRGIARLIGDMPPRIEGITIVAANHVELTILSQPDLLHIIEVSTNTVNWTPIFTNRNQSALFNYVDSDPIDPVRRFYRVRQAVP